MQVVTIREFETILASTSGVFALERSPWRYGLGSIIGEYGRRRTEAKWPLRRKYFYDLANNVYHDA